MNNLILASFAALMFFAPVKVLAENSTGPVELPGFPYKIEEGNPNYVCSEVAVEFFIVNNVMKTLGHTVCVAKSFSNLAQNLLRQSYRVFLDRLTSEKTYKCLVENTSLTSQKPLRSWPDYLDFFVLRALSPEAEDPLNLATIHPRYVYISGIEPKDGKPEVYATGYLGSFDNPEFLNQNQGWKRYISVGVRADLVGVQAPSLLSNVDFWAGMLANGYGKNLGLTEDLNNLPGTTLYEFSRCIYFQSNIPVDHRANRREGRK